MKMCPECEYVICDFCKHHNFAEYLCHLHKRTAYPTDGCNDFECRKYVEPKGEKEIDDLPPDEWIDQMMAEVCEGE